MNKLIGLSLVALASMVMMVRATYYMPYMTKGGGPLMTYSYSNGGMMGGLWEFLVFIIVLIIIAGIFDVNGNGHYNGGHSGGGGNGGYSSGGGHSGGYSSGGGHSGGYSGMDGWWGDKK